MITVEDNGDELYVVDAEKNEVTIQMTGWEPGGSPREIDRRVDKSIAGSASELQFPEAAVCIESEGDDQWTFFGKEIGPQELGYGEHLIQIENNIIVFIKFRGSAAIRRISYGDDVVVSFKDDIGVTLGFRSRVQLPIGTITTPPTPRGIATYVSNTVAAIDTTSPNKSYPSLRCHPPLLEFGEETNVPSIIQKKAVNTNIHLYVPNNLASVIVASPLAYYLQASLRICKDNAPSLLAPAIGLEHTLQRLPDLQFDIADLLRRIFYLDSLIRNVGPYGTDITEFNVLDDLGINARELYDSSPEVRLTNYLDIAQDEIEPFLPDWHLSMFVEPEICYAPILPYLLNHLSLIFLPKANKLNPEELIKYSLDETERRQPSVRSGGPTRSAEPLKSASRPGHVQGWVADGVPIDTFKALPDAFENRFDFSSESSGKKKVAVILNEPEMNEEQIKAQEIYHQRSAEISIEIDIKNSLSRRQLVSIFEKPLDFVHYIGHCEKEGLRCSDGNVSISDINESNVRTFFLNACNSYQHGLELIEKGSVAGAVTLERVLDRQATRVGTAFSRLVVHGFTIERALNIARSQAVLNKAYIAIGDGTYTLSQSNNKYPQALKLDKIHDDMFRVLVQHSTHGDAGVIYDPYINGTKKYLSSTQADILLSRSELRGFLSKGVNPIVYENELFWTDEIFDILE